MTLPRKPKMLTGADRQAIKGKQYVQLRMMEIDRQANRRGIVLMPKERQALYDICNQLSQGVFAHFQTFVESKLDDFMQENPERVHTTPLGDWFDDSMTEQEIAWTEVLGWLNLNYWMCDTETTGLDAVHDVAWSIAFVNEDDEAQQRVELYMCPLDSKNKQIPMKKGATATHGKRDGDMVQHPPVESPDTLEQLETLVRIKPILVAYNAQFDRGMFNRTLTFAIDRAAAVKDRKTESRLQDIRDFFRDGTNWLECKDIFCRAIGVNPDSQKGRRTTLERVAREIGALLSDEKQPHGAMADAMLMAKIVRKIQEKATVAGSKLKKPATQPEPEPEDIEETPEHDPDEQGQGPTDDKEYIQILEANNTSLKQELADMLEQVVRLREQTARMADLGGAPTETDNRPAGESPFEIVAVIAVNGLPMRIAARQGVSFKSLDAAIGDFMGALANLKGQDSCVTLEFAAPGDHNWFSVKGKGKLSSGEKPNAQAGGSKDKPPAGNSPGKPPAGSVPPSSGNKPPAAGAPAGAPPSGASSGNVERKSRDCFAIQRLNAEKGGYFWQLRYMSGGQVSQWPMQIKKPDFIERLDATIKGAGYDPMAFDVGMDYNMNIRVTWIQGGLIPNNKNGAHYMNDMQFEIVK